MKKLSAAPLAMKVSARDSSVVAATAKAELEVNGGLVLRPDITRNLFCRVMVNKVNYLTSKVLVFVVQA